jgi:S1-C subfamily serine protease
MVRKAAAAVVCLGLSSACGGGDPAQLDVSQREATAEECENGGLVLALNGEEEPAICNGVPGADGSPGAPGMKGDAGARGAPGAVGATGSTGPSGQAGASAAAELSQTISCISSKRHSLVGIQCTDGVTAELGSGTVTPSGQVFTAGHVVASIATLPCSIFDVDVDHSTLIGTVTNVVPDAVYDAAVLNVSWVGATPAGIPTVVAPPALGELVVSTGHPDALFALQYAAGFVTAVNVNELAANWAGAFMADYSSNSGGSGGAVFNADCEWIGIHVGGFSDGFETSIALPF